MIRTLDYPDVVSLDGDGFALRSPAKINLQLRVLGKRPDGFHELDTIFQEIDLCDRIEFHEAERWTLEIHGPTELSVEDNLISKAAQRLSEFAGVPCNAHVVLHKHIPVGGGLGGGSSNAAITLHGLSRLWRLVIAWEELQKIAADLGSDCAYFVFGGCAHGRGRGEKLELWDGAPEGIVVVVVPDFGVSTAWAFSNCSLPLTEPDKNVIFTAYPGNRQGGYALSKTPVNDLENIVLDKHSELRTIRDELIRAGAHVSLLSGSGSTVFGIFQRRTEAMHAAQQLSNRHTVHICRMIGRDRFAESS